MLFAESASPKVRQLAELIERWVQIVETQGDIRPSPDGIKTQTENDAEAATKSVEQKIERLALAAMKRPARTADDIVLRALITFHMSGSHRTPVVTREALYNGAPAWDLACSILALSGYSHLIRRLDELNGCSCCGLPRDNQGETQRQSG